MDEVTGSEADVARLFAPRSVAVIGASARPGALSWWPLHLLRTKGFTGDVYPVNPTRDEIDGLRCYASVGDVPGPVDLAIVALDADRSLQAVRECVAAGVGAVVLPTQGFGEQGADGLAKERELAGYATAGGLRIVGTNTDGIGNIASGAIASIQPLFDEGIRPGPVAVATQSGATAGSLLVRLKREGIGCRLYASAGNETDLGLVDYLSVMVQDPEVKLVLSFVEALRRPQEFLKVAALAARLGKPIVLIKVGRSAQGARRAAAHTGALAGSDEVYDAIFDAYGVIRVDELGELVAVAKLFLSGGTPKGRGIGILSVSGGQAGAVADRAVSAGLTVPDVGPDIERELDEILTFGSGFNPCDLTGEVARDVTLAARVYGAFSREPRIGTIVYARKHLTGDAGAGAAAQLARVAHDDARTPVAVYAMDGEVTGAEREAYDGARIPVFASLGELFVAVDRLERRAAWPGPPAARGPAAEPDPHLELTAGVADAATTSALLRRYGLPAPAEELAADAGAAVAAAERIGFPVVLKVVSDRIAHKTEAGGVALGLVTADDVVAAHDRIRAGARRFLGGEEADGVLVQEQVAGGVEMIAGVKVDPEFGPFVLVGVGGVATELLGDVALRPAPVGLQEARQMIAGLRTAPLLQGFRGAPVADVAALAQVLVDLSRLAFDHAATLAEADLNPVLVLPEGQGVRIPDALFVGREEAS